MRSKRVGVRLGVLLLFANLGFPAAPQAGNTGHDTKSLIKLNLARSDLQARDCTQMYRLDGNRYECGYLRVPENYEKPSSQIIRIPFLVIVPDESSFDRSLEPLLVTGGGGPGSAILGTRIDRIGDDDFWTYEEMSVVDGRSLIILENRGVGLSEPNLDCHYQPEIFQRNYWSEILRTDLSCGGIFREEGIDLAQYNVRSAALDIEMFRSLYGKRGVNTKQLNLYGISYGTHVAMYYERLFPLATRSMVLDSVSINVLESTGEDLEYAQRSLDLVFLKCRSDSSCRERFGSQLEEEFYQFLDRVESQKISLVVSRPDNLRPISLPLTGPLIVNVLHDALYSSDSIAAIPLIIRTMINGSYDRLTTGLRDHIFSYSLRYPFSDTAFLTYLCFDESYAVTGTADLSGLKLYRYWELDQGRQYMRRVCAEYDIAAEPKLQFDPYISDTPTMFLSGELDPVTPPENARLAAAKVSDHWNIVHSNVSHDVISHSSCARLLASWFIFHPQEDLDKRENDCDTTEHTIRFLLD